MPPTLTRITFLTWRDLGHPDGGGSEVYVEEIAARLAARGYAVTIRCPRYAGARRREVVRGVRYRRSGGRLTVYPRGLAYLLTPGGRRQDIVVDVVNGIPFGAPLARRAGVVALVHHLHDRQWDLIYPGWRGRLGWWIESRLVPRLYRRVEFITVSEASRRDLERIGIPASRSSVVRNGLAGPSDPASSGVLARDPAGATGLAGSTRPTSDVAASPNRIVVLTRLVPHKRVEDALDVVRRLAPEFPDLHLDVIGHGWWGGELSEAAAHLGVSDRVTFHGFLDNTERDAMLGASWVMLLPSAKEGWGLAVMEAAAAGTPTIGYRYSGGLTESVVDGRTGLLADDLEGLVAATRRLLGDASLRAEMSVNAKQWASRFDWETSASEFEAVVQRVARSGAATRRSRGPTGRRP